MIENIGGSTSSLPSACRSTFEDGAPGTTSSNLLIHADGTEEVLPSMFSITIQPDDVYVHRTAGGGGWGDPRDRDPQRVADDVADGKVTPSAARERYGWQG